MQVALAFAPLLAVLVVMIGLRKSAAWAGGIGLVVALVASAMAFDLSRDGSLPLLLAHWGPLAEALSTTAMILWIILPALALYEFQSRTGALDRIRDALTGLTPNRSLQVLLIAWFFGLALEGAAGFGTPVALAAPLLVGLGLPPLRAVAVALLGHAPGVSFGAIGTPVLAQVELSELSGMEIACATALLHLALASVIALLMLRIAREGALTRSDVGQGIMAAISFLAPMFLLAAVAGPEVATIGGALIGGCAFVLLILLRGREESGRPALRAIGRDLAPYLLIVGLVLASRTIPPLREALVAPRMTWSLAEGVFTGELLPFFHPGTILMVGLLGGALLTGRREVLMPSVAAALRRLAPVALALLLMLALARVMVHAGMIVELAAAATGVGVLWPLMAPFVGVLGTFVTGSATASNILFTPFQIETARALSLAEVPMVAAQGFGAAIGNAVAPHNIIAGSATVGLSRQEGEVLSLTLLPVLVYALLGGLLLLWWVF